MVGVLVRGHCVVIRNGGDAGADESGHAAGGAARLLRTPPAQTPQVQERHFPQLPRLQTRETRLGLLRTSGVRNSAQLHCCGCRRVTYKHLTCVNAY